MINFLDTVLVNNYGCSNTKLYPLFQALKFFILLVQISVPFGLILFGSLDFFKALIAHDEKEMRMKRKPFVQRFIAAMIILVLPWIMQTISKYMAGQSESDNIWKCYSQARARLDFSGWQQGRVTVNCDELTVDSPTQCDHYGCTVGKPAGNKYICAYKTNVDPGALEKRKKDCKDYSASKCPNNSLAENGKVCKLQVTKKKVKVKKNGKTTTKTTTTKKCVRHPNYN